MSYWNLVRLDLSFLSNCNRTKVSNVEALPNFHKAHHRNHYLGISTILSQLNNCLSTTPPGNLSLSDQLLDFWSVKWELCSLYFMWLQQLSKKGSDDYVWQKCVHKKGKGNKQAKKAQTKGHGSAAVGFFFPKRLSRCPGD